MLQTRSVLTASAFVLQIWLVFGQNPRITPDKNPFWVLSPGAINLTCVVTGDTTIAWKKDGVDLNGSRFNISVNKQGSNGAFTTTSLLTVLNPTASDAGHYLCKDVNSAAEATRIVKVLEVAVTNANYTRDEDALLRCDPVNMQTGVNEKTHFTINRDKLLESEMPANYKVDHDNHTLEITNLARKDIGEYQCLFTFVNGEDSVTLVQSVHLFAAPIITKFERSKNMVQGDTLKLKCFVTGHPAPVVVWKRDDEGIDVSDERINIKDLEDKNVVVSEGGLLTIFDLKFEDRAEYQCEANNTFGSDHSKILVRVKDKLAALWPFLGIVAEVIILCTIIFIYEKRRSKDTDDEEDGAPLQKTANAQDHKGTDEVRQRKP